MGRSKKRKGKAKRPRRRIPRPAGTLTPEAKRNRITRKRPIAAEGEPQEDIAVFDLQARSSLPPDVAAQAATIQEALDLLSQSRDEDALDRLRVIPRRSPLSEWRLFARGLVDWYADRFDQAERAWQKLDPSRRPARIVTVLRESQREPSAPSDGSSVASAAPSVASTAQLVRTLRIERPALRDASARLSQIRDPKGDWIGRDTIEWLKGFVHEHRWMDPDLVQSLEAAAIHRAAMQPYVDLFAAATRAFRGPDHDPKLTLLSSQYEGKFEGGDVREAKLLRSYLKNDLPRCERLSPAVRGAIASHLHLEAARELAVPPNPFARVMRLMGRYQPQDTKQIEEQFREAVESYPTNREAHEEFAAWVESRIDDDRASKGEREKLSKLLSGVMARWSESLPDEVEPRLWLVDHYLEEEQLESAKPHVDWLSSCRHEDPRVRATPWKWELLEALRLARRKSRLPQVEQRLDAAEAMWPDWLPQRWLPYLRAAVAWRGGDKAGFEARRAETSGSSPGPLTDAVMMLAAAQRMRVPAGELKEFRHPVDDAVRSLRSISTPDLMDAGSFFWDLQRVSLLYPAYRMHGSKIGRELISRLDGKTKLPSPQGDAAVLWMGHFRFWGASRYECGVPRGVIQAARENPHAAAAILLSVIQADVSPAMFPKLPFDASIELVRSAAKTAVDRFDRYHFATLADRASEARSKFSLGHGFAPGGEFGWYPDDDDDDDDEDQWFDDDADDADEYEAELDPDRTYEFFMSDDHDDPPEPDPKPKPMFIRFDTDEETDAVPAPSGADHAPEKMSDEEFRRTRPKDPLGRKKRNKKGSRSR